MKKFILSLIIFLFTFVVIGQNVAAQVEVSDDIPNQGPLDNIKLDIFFPADYTVSGLYSIIALAFITFLAVMFIAWIVYSIIGAIKIIASGGNEQGFESGIKYIKNVIIGIAVGFAFFVVLSLVGVILGFGSVVQWPNKLSQCGDEFKFQAEERLQDELNEGLVTRCISSKWVTRAV